MKLQNALWAMAVIVALVISLDVHNIVHSYQREINTLRYESELTKAGYCARMETDDNCLSRYQAGSTP